MLDFSKNYFELFGLPVDFKIDAADLAQRYRDLQRAVHPDRYAAASDQERRLSLQGASQVNEAYKTLKDPLLRARYLLELKGIAVDEGSTNTADTAFLMEQMEWREELAETKQHADPFAALSKLTGLMERIEGRIQALLAAIARCFEADTPQALAEARDILSKLRFLERLRCQAEELEAGFDDGQ